MDHVDASLREALRDAMGDHVTVADLTVRTGLSRPYVGRIYSGQRPASTAVWSRLLDAAMAQALHRVVMLAAEGSLSATVRDKGTLCAHGRPLLECRPCEMLREAVGY